MDRFKKGCRLQGQWAGKRKKLKRNENEK